MEDHASVPKLRRDRPALVLTSTSWTPDEDFSILLEALTLYEHSARTKKLPKLLMLVTGKGPLKEEYMKRILKQIAMFFVDNIYFTKVKISSLKENCVINICNCRTRKYAKEILETMFFKFLNYVLKIGEAGILRKSRIIFSFISSM